MTVEVLREGDAWWFHRHRWVEVPWDRERFGPDMTDVDDPHSSQAPHATFKTHYRCRCGCEIIVAAHAMY